jgi:hypothetical protein
MTDSTRGQDGPAQMLRRFCGEGRAQRPEAPKMTGVNQRIRILVGLAVVAFVALAAAFATVWHDPHPGTCNGYYSRAYCGHD